MVLVAQAQRYLADGDNVGDAQALANLASALGQAPTPFPTEPEFTATSFPSKTPTLTETLSPTPTSTPIPSQSPTAAITLTLTISATQIEATGPTRTPINTKTPQATLEPTKPPHPHPPAHQPRHWHLHLCWITGLKSATPQSANLNSRYLCPMLQGLVFQA